MTGNSEMEQWTEQGAADVAAGLDTLEAAADVADIGKAALVAGASDVTRGVDAMVVAERMARLSDLVGAAGVTDVAEGMEMLEAADDVDLMSAVVGLMSADDLERGLEIARIAGELWAVGDVVDMLEMPILADFLESRGEALQMTAVDVMLQAVSTRALSVAMSEEAVRSGHGRGCRGSGALGRLGGAGHRQRGADRGRNGTECKRIS
jgi:hypothetical protein